MDFQGELNTLCEFSDYSPLTIQLLKSELTQLHEVYSELWPAGGWGLKEEHNISMKGYISADYEKESIKVPFGICFPLLYPDSPPLCNIILNDNYVLIPNKKLTAQGALSIKILRNWRNTNDSFEVIQKCAKFISKHKPLLSFESYYFSEMWNLRRKLDELYKDEYKLEKMNKEVNKSIEMCTILSDPESLQDLRRQNMEIENWIEQNRNRELEFDKLISYKNRSAKVLLELWAEEESCEDVGKKLIEGFYAKALSGNDCMLLLKQVYNDRFIFMKKRELLMKKMREFNEL